jgi:cell division protein FtsB
MQKILSHFKQLLLIALIVAAVFLLLDYQARMSQLYEIEAQRKNAEGAVVELKQTEKALLDELEYANSQAMVEEFARDDINAGQPGDVIVVPIAPTGATPTPQPTPTTVPVQVDKWEIWQALLLGDAQ